MIHIQIINNSFCSTFVNNKLIKFTPPQWPRAFIAFLNFKLQYGQTVVGFWWILL